MNFLIYTELHIIVKIVKRERVRLFGHVAGTGEASNVYRMWLEKFTNDHGGS